MINNLGLGTFETSEETLGSLYDQTKTGFWETAGATVQNAWNYNPTFSLFRAKEQIQAYQSSNIYLNRDELNKQYGPLGLVFKEDTREGVVDYLVERKKIEIERNNIIARGPNEKLAKSFFFFNIYWNKFFRPYKYCSIFRSCCGSSKICKYGGSFW